MVMSSYKYRGGGFGGENRNGRNVGVSANNRGGARKTKMLLAAARSGGIGAGGIARWLSQSNSKNSARWHRLQRLAKQNKRCADARSRKRGSSGENSGSSL